MGGYENENENDNDNGELFCWGLNFYGQLDIPDVDVIRNNGEDSSFDVIGNRNSYSYSNKKDGKRK